MNTIHLRKALALLAIAGLAACGGGGGSSSNVTPPTKTQQTGPNPMFATLVGVGDSLTAGYQSEGLLGVPTTNPWSILPGGLVPPTQENGFWTLLFEQATGTSAATMANPATSVLPLIAAPGIASQLIPTNPAGPLEAPLYVSHPGCDSFNQSTYSAAGFTSVRANPAAKVLDVAVPGITAHEAVNMIGPLTGAPPAMQGTYPTPTVTPLPTYACPPYKTLKGDPTSGGLQSLIAGESSLFIPMLGQYLSTTHRGELTNGQPSTELNAAAMLKPTFATVWLGANDLLKFALSGGKAPMVDLTSGQIQADVTLAVKTLQKAGAQGVAVANLPTVLETPQFFRGGTPPAQAACLTQNWLYCDLVSEIEPALAANPHVPPGDAGPLAQSYAAGIITALVSNSNYGFSNDTNWYLTEAGFFATLGKASSIISKTPLGSTPNFSTISLDPSGPGSGLGGAYINDSLATQTNNLNVALNAGIQAAATNTGSAFVDIDAVFNGLYNATGPYFDEAASINPAPNPATGAPFTCCSLVFTQGLVSFDGLHPSDTGYALIANVFIASIDAKYANANIPPLSASQIETIYATDPYAPH